jgi:cytoplasmic iron level regulating protein YaaA (DUF328/UPF0246 family)
LTGCQSSLSGSSSSESSPFKNFGRKETVLIDSTSGTTKEDNISSWRRVRDDEAKRRADKVVIMVAGLRMVCQAIDLPEGAVFKGLKAHTINAKAIQMGYQG